MTRLQRLSFAVAAACAFMGAVPAFAQQEGASESEPATVVATATRGAKALDKIPGAVTVIGQPELSTQYLIADDSSQALATHIPGDAPSRQLRPAGLCQRAAARHGP